MVDMVIYGLGTSQSYVCPVCIMEGMFPFVISRGTSGSVTNVSDLWIWMSRCDARVSGSGGMKVV